ncbi:hypothetical protein Tco_0608583 [Tanacetum coccineum]
MLSVKNSHLKVSGDCDIINALTSINAPSHRIVNIFVTNFMIVNVLQGGNLTVSLFKSGKLGLFVSGESTIGSQFNDVPYSWALEEACYGILLTGNLVFFAMVQKLKSRVLHSYKQPARACWSLLEPADASCVDVMQLVSMLTYLAADVDESCTDADVS